MVIGEKMVEAQVLCGAPKLPDRDGVPSKLDLGVSDANLHDAQFFTGSSIGVDPFSRDSLKPRLPQNARLPNHLPLTPFRRNGQTGAVLLIDAANVVGSRPTGWWRDRAGAARVFVDQLRAATGSGRLPTPVVVVLEGKARDGVQAGVADGVTVLLAVASGDDMLIDVTSSASDQVTLITADRGLRNRAEALGANVLGPRWLFELLEE